MRRRTWRAALVPCIAVVASSASATPARADKQIVAGPPQRYTTPEVTMDQGERLTFVNQDVEGHTVTSQAAGPDGKRLFDTPLIGAGEQAFVEGSQFLTTGTYAFFCKVHSGMEGTLHVSTAGTPVPRPRDTRAPQIRLRILDARASGVRRRRALKARVAADEAVSVRLSARGRGRKLATGRVTLAGPGARSVRLRLTRPGRRALARNATVRVLVSARATDPAGNTTRKTARRTLRR